MREREREWEREKEKESILNDEDIAEFVTVGFGGCFAGLIISNKFHIEQKREHWRSTEFDYHQE